MLEAVSRTGGAKYASVALRTTARSCWRPSQHGGRCVRFGRAKGNCEIVLEAVKQNWRGIRPC